MTAQRFRLATGLVLFSYVTTHLLNHSLGLISLQAAEAGRFWFIGLWRHPLTTALLYASLLVHIALALAALYRRRHLHIPRWEIVRLTLGLLIPLQLISHVFGTRVQDAAFGVEDTYARVVLNYWVLNPQIAFQQMALLIVAWVHGCLGIHYWLRVKPWHVVTIPILRVLGFVVPLLALGGFVDMGQELSELAVDPAWLEQAYTPLAPEQQEDVNTWRDVTRGVFIVAVVSVFAARRVRTLWERRRKGIIRLTYPSGRRVLVTPGTSVLEASRAAGIPHASLCGGRGRCSTCRTRVGAGLELLPKPSPSEARVLRRVGAPPNVRLACQLRPTADLEVFPLLPAAAGRPGGALAGDQSHGREQEVAILFADLRAFTRFAEHRLPYDVVFVLNEYFAAMGTAVEQAGGYLDKFIGDGVMALFGLDGDASLGCRQSLSAALEMGRALERINHALASDLQEPLRIGIGIHVGRVIVGDLGHGRARSLTAIGDAVNTASRLESLTKEYASQLIVSEDVARAAGVDLTRFPRHEIAVRGRTAPLPVRVIPTTRELESVLAE
jgi:adenylate cyclase